MSGGNNMAYLLGVDIGTSGTKTVLFDENGNTVASMSRSIRCTSPGTDGRNRNRKTGGRLLTRQLRMFSQKAAYRTVK